MHVFALIFVYACMLQMQLTINVCACVHKLVFLCLHTRTQACIHYLYICHVSYSILSCNYVSNPSPPFIPPSLPFSFIPFILLPSSFTHRYTDQELLCRIGEVQSNGDHRQQNWHLHPWFDGPPPVGFAAQHLRVMRLVDKF